MSVDLVFTGLLQRNTLVHFLLVLKFRPADFKVHSSGIILTMYFFSLNILFPTVNYLYHEPKHSVFRRLDHSLLRVSFGSQNTNSDCLTRLTHSCMHKDSCDIKEII
jgi:hypothetical protein